MFHMNDLFFIMLLICLIKGMGGYLIMLVFLEVIMFLGFLSFLELVELGWYNSSLIYSLCYLIMMIFESVFGLCLMLSLVREEGGDYYMNW